jgi:hypothetical protein
MSTADTTSDKPTGGRDDSVKLVLVMNAPLVGVPAAYAVSDSVAITVVTAVVTAVTAVAYLVRNRR